MRSEHQHGVNYTNLETITPTKVLHQEPPMLDVCLINTRSVRNKSVTGKDHVVDTDADITTVTETWLNSDEEDAIKC